VTKTFTESGEWVCPAGVTSVTVECRGGGAAGGTYGSADIGSAGGGGGGAYASSVKTVIPFTMYRVNVGLGGLSVLPGTGGSTGLSGQDSWFKNPNFVMAKGGTGGEGSNGAAVYTGGAGGAAGNSVGTTTNSGGAGGNTTDITEGGGGGGGGAGSTGVGGTGGDTSTGTGGVGGTGGTSGGGTGGDGGTGTGASTDGLRGLTYGGGGGGAGSDNVTSRASGGGAPGVVILTWTKPGVSNSNSLANVLNNVEYAQLGQDDGDYYIQYGSEYIITEFSYTHLNNTDAIQIVWNGRSTLSTKISPVFLQIYNNNTLGWDTLIRETRFNADVDFNMSYTQTSSLSNYYDSSRKIVVRVYQQVF